MSKFKDIDIKLNALAIKLNATLTKDRLDYPGLPNAFEERRIDWEDNHIRKAIIIQPNFEIGDVNLSKWNLINLAWIEKNSVAQKPGWKKKLVDNNDFKVIVNNIDELLNQSVDNLNRVGFEDFT